MRNIPITLDNVIYANAVLDYTHDYSGVKEGTIMFDRKRIAWLVTKIDTDDCNRRRFWAADIILGVQYSAPHNMLTKSPFYAYEYTILK
jgi:hypothetical protein